MVDVIARHTIVALVEHTITVAPGPILAGPVDHVCSATRTHMVTVVEGRENAGAFVAVVLDHCPTGVWAFL